MATPVKSDELWSQWSRKIWKPHYLFAGQEDFLTDQALQKALQHWLGDDREAMGLDRLDAETQPVEEIVQAAQTAPFFGGQRVVLVKNASQLSPSDQERLGELLTALSSETHCLFLWGREWRKRDDPQKALVEAVDRTGQVVIFWPPFPEQAQRWAVERGRHYKKTLNPEAAAWLVQQSGEGLRLLDQELAKCAAYVGERPDITLDDVQASFGYQKASSPFEWLAFIRRQEAPAAVQVLNHLLVEGDEPVRLLALLSRSLRDWLGAKSMGETAGMIGMRFHVKRGEENRFMQELRRWSEEALADGVRQCVDAEQAIKTGKETPEMALTLLTLGLCSDELAHAI